VGLDKLHAIDGVGVGSGVKEGADEGWQGAGFHDRKV